MKLIFIISALFFSLFTAKGITIPRDKYVSVQKLISGSSLNVKLSSKGGYQGFCMEMDIENNSGDTCFAWVEAGRRLVSEDEKQQDIFIVKNAYVIVEPGNRRKFSLFGFCCKSHHASPKAGSVFFIGRMEGRAWQSIAKVIDANEFDNSAIQAAVWTISNDHPVSSIDRGKEDKNYLLLKTVADIKNIELPWYNIDYKKESNHVFSNKPSHIYARIDYKLPYYGEVTIVVRTKTGIIKATLLEEIPKNEGLNSYFLDLDVAGWKDGIYYFELVQDGNKIIERRKFEIDTGGD